MAVVSMMSGRKKRHIFAAHSVKAEAAESMALPYNNDGRQTYVGVAMHRSVSVRVLVARSNQSWHAASIKNNAPRSSVGA